MLSTEKWEFFVGFISFFLALVSIVYTLGIVWRAEKKLDISYKLFLLAISFFMLSELAAFIPKVICQQYKILLFIPDFLKILFSIFFLAGVLTIRSAIRKMDGEETEKEEKINIEENFK